MNPKIEWCNIKTRRCLFLQFDGNLSEEDAEKAISRITSMIEAVPDKVLMVWECSRMTSFDKGARDAWQKFIKAVRSRLEAIHLVSKKLVIRVGAYAVGSYAGIRITTWGDMYECSVGL